MEKIFEIDLISYVEERPVFAIRIDSDTIPMQGFAMLPLSDHNQKEIMEELETDDLDKCEILRLDCGDAAFARFAAAGKAEIFRGIDDAMAAVENVRNSFALRETQDMDIRM